jgi:hypothetical protein
VAGAGLTDWVKSLLMLAVYLFAVWLLVSRSWRKEPVLVSVIVPTILWGTVYVAVLIWPIMRFARLMIIPLWLYLDTHVFRRVDGETVLPYRSIWYVVLVLCFLSQFVWAYYVAYVFFAR